MPRTHKRKTERGKNPEMLKRAARIVILENLSVRSVAKDFDVNYSTLQRLVNKLKKDADGALNTPLEVTRALTDTHVGYVRNRQVFSDNQEEMLVQYILRAAAMYFGLTPDDVRKFAYELAIAYEVDLPQSWTENQKAGKDWFCSFLKRHPNVSIRAAEKKSAILTDTPEKEAIMKRKSASKSKGKSKSKSKTPNNTQKEKPSKGTDWYCEICGESYSNSKPGEKWVKCLAEGCEEWSHVECTENGRTFICSVCE
ncbi:uncharacterized protein [Antedon mediterranea]|uniref:uncharacterized protein n=1 Tax=Antedon mediterranea TaxID=105859 RepID=UPI003AF796A2